MHADLNIGNQGSQLNYLTDDLLKAHYVASVL